MTPRKNTFYLGHGTLPSAVLDKTKAASSGRLLLRVECDKGKFAPVLTIAGNDVPATFSCNGQRQQKYLNEIRTGQEVSIHPQGDEGTSFAMELVIVSTAGQP